MRRVLSVALALLLVGSAIAASGAASAENSSVTDLGTDHPLAEDTAVQQYDREGYATGEMDRYRITLTMSETRDDVDLQPSAVSDVRNHYLRIDYDEDHHRTLRVLIPREYVTPYTQEDVDSINSGHTADLEPARDRQYIAVVVEVHGPSEIVIPMEKDAAASYAILERTEDRIESVTGVSPLGSDAEWTYVEEDELIAEAAVPVDGDPDQMLIQYDAKPDEAEEYWLNAPEGEQEDVSVYYFVRESEDDQVYLVAKGEEAPTVRYKQHAGYGDRVEGWINDAMAIPDRVSGLADGFGIFGDG